MWSRAATIRPSLHNGYEGPSPPRRVSYTRTRALQLAQQSGRESLQSDATECDAEPAGGEPTEDSSKQCNPLKMSTLRDDVREDASHRDSSRGGTRTRTGDNPHGILSPVRLPIPPLGRIVVRLMYYVYFRNG